MTEPAINDTIRMLIDSIESLEARLADMLGAKQELYASLANQCPIKLGDVVEVGYTRMTISSVRVVQDSWMPPPVPFVWYVVGHLHRKDGAPGVRTTYKRIPIPT
jgi:hypothetical protein